MLNTISHYIFINKPIIKRAIKLAFCAFIIISLAWTFYLKEHTYKFIYGLPYPFSIEISKSWVFSGVYDATPFEVLIDGYKAMFEPMKNYEIRGKVAYVDKYSKIGAYYRYSGNKGAYFYDAISPFDVAIVHGESAESEVFDKIEFSHGYRYLEFWWNKEKINLNKKDINNMHIIPANDKIAKGFEVLKKGDIVKIEGVLVNVKGLGENKDLYYQTAIIPEETTYSISGGEITDLSHQILVGRLVIGDTIFE